MTNLTNIVPNSSRFPRLLIVENNLLSVEPLIRTFEDRNLDFDFDVCTSHDHAVIKLFHAPPRYQLVISRVQMAERHDFLLLEHNQLLQPFVPFVVTAIESEKELAARVLERGAFDLITYPLEHEQTVNTIRLALWQGKLQTMIARKEAALDKYRQHLATYPDDGKTMEVEVAFNRVILAFEKTMSCVERTILRIEESTVCFSDFAKKVEYHARKRALERLWG